MSSHFTADYVKQSTGTLLAYPENL